MYNRNQKLKEIIDSEKIDLELALNLIINAVGSNWNNYGEVDKFLIGKCLETFQWHFDNKKDLVIEFSKRN